VQPSSSNHVCNAQFMADVFSNPRRGGIFTVIMESAV
jgi:hypothetical protein